MTHITHEDQERLKRRMVRAQRRYEEDRTNAEAKASMVQAQRAYEKARMARLEFEDPFEFYITDHAALRFIQRRMGLDLNEVKKAMLTEINTDIIQELGQGKYPLSEGGRLIVVENGAAVTFIQG